MAEKRNKIIIISVILLLVLCLVLFLVLLQRPTQVTKAVKPEKQPMQKETVTVDSSKVFRDTVHSVVALVNKPHKHKAVAEAIATLLPDTLKQQNKADTSIPVLQATRPSPCAGDTVAPWVFPDPSGGLHRKQILVTLESTKKPCAIEWKTDSSAPWKPYLQPIALATSTTLFFRAHDSCGNAMENRQEKYEIDLTQPTKFCPENMEFVKAGQTVLCIDKYEWPNKKGVVPQTYISLYQAMDSCVAAGKHLCSTDEWTLACTGPYGWQYPYGDSYERHACVTNDTVARPSGSKPECRGYFDVFDMAGNCAEWTSTRSTKNRQFYNVKGGFWESGLRSTCFETKYSYYPQNRHNPVGFRCCKEAAQ